MGEQSEDENKRACDVAAAPGSLTQAGLSVEHPCCLEVRFDGDLALTSAHELHLTIPPEGGRRHLRTEIVNHRRPPGQKPRGEGEITGLENRR